MNLEKLLEQVFANPNNINIQYSNINGEEKLIVNGEEITSYDDSLIKEKIRSYKEKLDYLDTTLFEKVLDAAEKHHLNLNEMNKGLELETYTREDAEYAESVMEIMTNVILEVIQKEIQNLIDILESF